MLLISACASEQFHLENRSENLCATWPPDFSYQDLPELSDMIAEDWKLMINSVFCTQ